MSEFVENLNEQQKNAVKHMKGPLLVLAGAGSGKTRVITTRVANLIINHNILPWRILAVTFTNKAAGEMRERIERLVPGKGHDCTVRTFHSLCARLLRKFGDEADVDPSFTIYDDQDQKAMVTRCLKELDYSPKEFPPRMIMSEINRAKREVIGVKEYPSSDFYREKVKMIYELYDKKMRSSNALDFGDLLFRVVYGMKKNKALHREISGLYDYILVDEFQDTNVVQLQLLELLCRTHDNICVVGDDDQSIYSWRGADIKNILNFDRIFPKPEIVTLERNYRSTQNILTGAHHVVRKLSGRRDKKLWTDEGEGQKIYLIAAEDEREEARHVANNVIEIAEGGISLGQQSVFYRINAQSRVFEEVFRTMDIPHRVVGGMRFYERAEVKNIIAYLRLVSNPHDIAAFLRIVNIPTRGIGKTTIDRLMSMAVKMKLSPYLAIDEAADSFGKGPVRKLVKFKDMVEKIRKNMSDGPAFAVDEILEETGYIEILKKENTAEADARIENIKELAGSIHDFQEEAEEPTVENYLELIALQSDVDQADFSQPKVSLMTVHSAKGLEFDAVHVTGLEEGLFPYKQAGRGTFIEDADEMAEERRLCYVAMTRAREKLTLYRAESRRIFGQNRWNPPSRFLLDIPKKICEDMTPSRSEIKPVLSKAQAKNKPHYWIDKKFDQSTDRYPVKIGEKVRHLKFGQGVVKAIHLGSGVNVEVEFSGFGRKKISIDYLDY